MNIDETRAEIQRVVNQRPFRQFLINLDNGDRLTVEHPENVAFDPTPGGQTRLFVITGSLTCFATLESISSVVMQDTGEPVGS